MHVVPASAQNYPSRPVTIVVPFPPGGNVDASTRILATSLSEQFGQTVLIENRPGAATVIGARSVARAAPDGYTLLVSGASTNISPLLTDDTTFNPEDLTLVALSYQTPWMLLVSPEFPAKNLAELIDYAKKNPTKITWAHQGPGSVQHLVSERFLRAAGIQATMVPYPGSAPAALEVMAGRIDMTMDSGGTIIESVQSGKLRAFAISGDQRFARFPDLPTFKEGGIDMNLAAWVGILAPKATPKDVLEKINRAVAVATDIKRFQDWASAAGGGTTKLSLVDAQKMFESDRVMWRDTVKVLGLAKQ
jgi:tripartite-type tricarboxylate transporter receptor subunit TctC